MLQFTYGECEAQTGEVARPGHKVTEARLFQELPQSGNLSSVDESK